MSTVGLFGKCSHPLYEETILKYAIKYASAEGVRETDILKDQSAFFVVLFDIISAKFILLFHRISLPTREVLFTDSVITRSSLVIGLE